MVFDFSRYHWKFQKQFRTCGRKTDRRSISIPQTSEKLCASGQLRSPRESARIEDKNPPRFTSRLELSFAKRGARTRQGTGRADLRRLPSGVAAPFTGKFALTMGEGKSQLSRNFPHTLAVDACTRRVYPIFTQFLSNFYPINGKPGQAHNCPLGLINSSAGVHPRTSR